MATDRQIQANRRNAGKSTGPRTPEGKAASRFNALQYGIHAESQCIPGEVPEELAALTRDYYEEYRPQGPTQSFLVDRLVLCHWLRQRYHRIQAELLAQLASDVEPCAGEAVLIGKAFLRSVNGPNDAVVKVFRQINANDRTYDRTLATLERLRAEAQEPEPETARPEGPQPLAKLGSFPGISKPAAQPASTPTIERSEAHDSNPRPEPNPQPCDGFCRPLQFAAPGGSETGSAR